jgi:hypothetical protein
MMWQKGCSSWLAWLAWLYQEVDEVRAKWMGRWIYVESEACCIPYPGSDRGALGDRRSKSFCSMSVCSRSD